MGGYSKSELFSFWKLFKDQHDAVRVLQDFALCDRAEAKSLIAEFETRHAAELLNLEHRGKSE